MGKIKWTKEEDKALKELWPSSTKEEISKFFNRTYASIVIRASNLGIKKLYEKHPAIQSDLSILLENTPETMYWVGFFVADGTVLDYKRIGLSVSIKDESHLLKFKKFCKIPTHGLYHQCIGVHAQDKITVGEFCKKFDLKPRKTYNPPNYIPKKEDLFLSFLAGFIDGDGNISKQSGRRKDFFIRIKLHNSWLGYLNKLSETITLYSGIKSTTAKINKQGYANINICNTIILKFIKTKISHLNLPFLKRKWDKIDLNYIGKKEKSIKNKKRLVELVRKNLKNIDIAEKLGVSQAWVSIQRKKIEKEKNNV